MQPTTRLADSVPTEEHWHLFMRSCAISFSRDRSRKLLGLNSRRKGSGHKGPARGGARPPIVGQVAQQRQGAADRSQCGEAAGAIAQAPDLSTVRSSGKGQRIAPELLCVPYWREAVQKLQQRLRGGADGSSVRIGMRTHQATGLGCSSMSRGDSTNTGLCRAELQGRDKGPKTTPEIQSTASRDKMRARILANWGLFIKNREISV